MEWLWGFLDLISSEVGAVAAILAILGVGALVLKKLRGKPDEVALNRDTIDQIAAPNSPRAAALNDVTYFINVRKALKAELEAELAEAHENEKAQLRARIAELEADIADPDAALAEAQKTIAELTARLERMGNEIGGDRLAKARAALERFDYSVADGIFAEVEARQELAVQEAARAAFGRGEVAEAEVRWADAAEHFARAARLDPSIENLLQAGMFLWRAGRHGDAIRFEEEAVDRSRADLGKAHPDYATSLNNLALLLDATGRHGEAEPLYREALAVTGQALGKAHPDYAIRLNNLAGLLDATGRHADAEPLYREALAVTEQALGKAHPDYANRLNNLAGLLRATGRHGEAEPLFREAVAVMEAALGEGHPDTNVVRGNLEAFLAERGEG